MAITTAERELDVPAGTLAELIAAQHDPNERPWSNLGTPDVMT